jgi:hypothetical protein
MLRLFAQIAYTNYQEPFFPFLAFLVATGLLLPCLRETTAVVRGLHFERQPHSYASIVASSTMRWRSFVVHGELKRLMAGSANPEYAVPEETADRLHPISLLRLDIRRWGVRSFLCCSTDHASRCINYSFTIKIGSALNSAFDQKPDEQLDPWRSCITPDEGRSLVCQLSLRFE